MFFYSFLVSVYIQSLFDSPYTLVYDINKLTMRVCLTRLEIENISPRVL